MSKIIKYINEYAPNENGDFLRYPIGADASNISLSYNNSNVEDTLKKVITTPGEGLTYDKENDVLKLNAKTLTIKEASGNSTYNGLSALTLDLSKYALSASANDLTQQIHWFTSTGRKNEKYVATDYYTSNSTKNKGTNNKDTLMIMTCKPHDYYTTTTGNYPTAWGRIKNGWRCLGSFTIPKGESWLITYTVSFLEVYRDANNGKKGYFWNMSLTSSNSGTRRDAMISSTAPTSSDDITGLNPYSGVRQISSKFHECTTTLSKTLLLPWSAEKGAIQGTTNHTYYLYATQDSLHTLPVTWTLNAIKLK
jgi:hypothetical protein